MPDGYYRIAANQSEADVMFYRHGALVASLRKAAPYREDEIPMFCDIRRTHRFPLKTQYKPVILMSNDIVKHTTNTNQFITGYNGDIQAQMYFKIYITAGTQTIDSFPWSFCENFVPALIKSVEFKVQGDIITEFDGPTLYLYSQMFVQEDKRMGLMRMWRETVVEWTYVNGGPATAAVDATYVVDQANFGPKMPHTSLQAPQHARGAFQVFVPLDNLSLTRGLGQSFPLSPLYALERVIEFEFNDIRNTINLFATDPTVYLDPYFTNTGAHLPIWSAIPAIQKTELYVNYILVHRDLQKTIAMNGYGYVIRQYPTEDISVTEASTRELSYTKVIEWVGLVGRFTRNVTRTATGAVVDPDGGGVLLAEPAYYKIDPFNVPIDTLPIGNVDVTARGQTFYREMTWMEMSAWFAYAIGGEDFRCSPSASLAVVPLTQRISLNEFLGSYNSGYGPNLTFKWTETAFSAGVATAGTLTFVLCCGNTFAAYRGTATVRYT